MFVPACLHVNIQLHKGRVQVRRDVLSNWTAHVELSRPLLRGATR